MRVLCAAAVFLPREAPNATVNVAPRPKGGIGEFDGATMPANMAAILKRLAVLAAVAALAACAGSPPLPAEPGGMAIVGAQLIDGTGGDPIADSVIVIRDDRIVAAGPRETTGIPAGADIVDAAGQTVIPGLVDMHNHYGGDVDAALEMLRTQLYFGVTTARSIGTDNPEQTALMLEAHAGRPDTPRMFTAGRGFSHPGGFNAGAQQPTSPDEAREMVRALAGQGVHFVKMWVNEMPEPDLKITPEMRTAIVEEAIANGLVPVAHIDEEADGRQLVEAGLSDFLHTTVRTFGPGAGTPMDDPDPPRPSSSGCAWTTTSRSRPRCRSSRTTGISPRTRSCWTTRTCARP